MAGADERAQLITRLMNDEGPTVKVVVLRTSGESEELKMDMTPKKNEVAQFLGGPATFVGQFPQLDVMVLKRRAPEGLTASKHQLQPPLHELEEPVHGDMLLVRMDENAEPQDFLLEEYSKFASQPIDASTSSSSSSSSSKAEAGSSSSSADAKGDADDEQQQAVLFKICEAFRGEFGREPTIDEVKGILRRLQGLEEEAEDEDNDDDEDEDDEEDSEDEDFAPDGMEDDDVDEVAEDEEHLED